MSTEYRAISWNRQKKIYDLVVVTLLLTYVLLFVGIGAWRNPTATAETLLIRAFGTAALLLLHVVLCIGPLARLNPRFLPLLYNRRHLGVTTFLVGLAHGAFALIQFHGVGDVNPLLSLFFSNPRYGSVPDFPFQALGFFTLILLFLMAATSHDFWLRNLSAPTWKRLHMLVYVAYALLVTHVVLGALQSESSPVLAIALTVGVATVLSLHLAAGFHAKRIDQEKRAASQDGFVEVCRVARIPENRATIVSLSGERVAIFRHDGKVSAVSNVCQHQNGPRAKAASSTDASPVPGTDTSINRRMGVLRRHSKKRSQPFESSWLAEAYSFIRSQIPLEPSSSRPRSSPSNCSEGRRQRDERLCAIQRSRFLYRLSAECSRNPAPFRASHRSASGCDGCCAGSGSGDGTDAVRKFFL